MGIIIFSMRQQLLLFLFVIVVVGARTSNNHQHDDYSTNKKKRRRFLSSSSSSTMTLGGGYRTINNVADIQRLEMDLGAMNSALQKGDFKVAKSVYENGGFSESISVLILDRPLENTFAMNTPVTGRTQHGQKVDGILAIQANRGVSTLVVFYLNQESCNVGGLPLELQHSVGCLAAENDNNNNGDKINQLEINALGTVTVNYTSLHHGNGASLSQLSLDAYDAMLICSHCPHVDFSRYHAYFGSPDYAHRAIEAAFGSERTNFENSRGNVDFSLVTDSARAHAIERGVVILHVYMYMISKLEDSLDACRRQQHEQEAISDKSEKNDDESIQQVTESWDQAAALYTAQHFLHHVIKRHCTHTNTCRSNNLNDQIIKALVHGQLDLQNGYCQKARQQKELIVQLLKVPLVQGALYYSYIIDRVPTTTTGSDEGIVKDEKATETAERAAAMGAVYALALLPPLFQCHAPDAQLLWQQLTPGGPDASFFQVKEILERNYACLGISCKSVGGLWDSKTSVYFQDAEPCTFDQSDEEKKETASRIRDGGRRSAATTIFVSIVGSITVGAVFIGLYFFAIRYANGNDSSFSEDADTVLDPDVMLRQGRIVNRKTREIS